MKPPEPGLNASVLLRLPNWVGDIVMATPCIEAIKRERPDIGITLAARRHLLPLLEGYPGIKEIIPIEGKDFASSLSFLRRIRSGHFSAIVVFAKGFRDGLIARCSGIPSRTGFSLNSRGIFFTNAVRMTQELWKGHHALQFAELVKPLGVSAADYRPFLPVRRDDLETADDLLEMSGLKKKEFIVFHVGASKFPRAYHSGRFAEAAEITAGRTGSKIALIGTAEDKPYIESFMEVFPGCADLSGAIPLGVLPAFLSLSRLFVGSDSGPMHIASAVGTPVVAVFGPGSPAKTAPLLPDEKKRIVYSALPCSPCRQSFFKDCDPSENGKPPCLELISGKVLAGQILELLEKN